MKKLLLLLPLALLLTAPMARAQLVHSEKSLYREVLVYEENGERCMCFTRQCRIGRQSCIFLNDPHRFALNYTRMMLAGTDELGYLLAKQPAIDRWEAAHPPRVDTRIGAQ